MSDRTTRISPAALSEVQAALKAYCAAVEESDLSLNSQATYIDMADKFVRWIKDEFTPGSRKTPYSIRIKGKTNRLSR